MKKHKKINLSKGYKCPQCGKLGFIEYHYPGGVSVLLSCNHILKKIELLTCDNEDGKK